MNGLFLETNLARGRQLRWAIPAAVLLFSVNMTGAVALEAGAAKSSGPAAVTAETPSETNPRLAVIERIVNAARVKMMASDDARAIALTAKFARDAGMKPGEVRDEKEKSDRQMATLLRARSVAKSEDKEFVEFQIALFCLAFPAKSVCLTGDPVREFAEANPSNAMGWLVMATREFSQGLHVILLPYLKNVGEAKKSEWYYSQAAATALKFARTVSESQRKPGDDEAASFALLNGLTLPPFQLFTQMCYPDEEGVLPEGRYPNCRRAARVLADLGRTQVEHIVGLRALERLAHGEKKRDEAERFAREVDNAEAASRYVWRSVQSYPPASNLDGERLALFFGDMLRDGERRALELALRRAGKSMADVEAAR